MNRILRRIAEDIKEINNKENEELFEKYQKALRNLKEFDEEIQKLINNSKFKEGLGELGLSGSVITDALYKVVFAIDGVYKDVEKAQYRRFKK